MTADHIQGICWSITYILLIVYAIQFKTHGIPLIAVCLNFAWETVALGGSLLNQNFSSVLIIHTAWFALDCIIIFLFYCYETKIKENRKEKVVFAWAYIICVVCLVILFLNGYMLLSCFVIDLIMAVSFLVFLISKPIYIGWNIYAVGVFKLLGDLFAWRYYRDVFLVDYIGIAVLAWNIFYLLTLVVKTYIEHKQRN